MVAGFIMGQESPHYMKSIFNSPGKENSRKMKIDLSSRGMQINEEKKKRIRGEKKKKRKDVHFIRPFSLQKHVHISLTLPLTLTSFLRKKKESKGFC